MLIHYYVSASGEVHFGINGQDRGSFFSGVDTRQPLWAMIDLYGNCTGIQMVDLRQGLNNFSSQQQQQQRPPHYRPLPPPQPPTMPPLMRAQPLPDPQVQIVNGHMAGMNLGPPNMLPQQPLAQQQPPPQPQPRPVLIPLHFNRHAAFRPLSFHFCTGRNARLGDSPTVAHRNEEEFSQGYVFTAGSVKLGERIVVQVLGKEVRIKPQKMSNFRIEVF